MGFSLVGLESDGLLQPESRSVKVSSVRPGGPDGQGSPDPEPGFRVDWQRFDGGWPRQLIV